MIELIKALIIFGSYCVIAPIGGWILSRDQRLEDFAMGVLVFLLGLHIDTTVLMLGSIEWYRGVTKGFEFTMMEVGAIALIFSSLFRSDRKFRWLPRGSLLWGLYIFCSLLSLASALNASYVFMSVLKFGKAWLIVYAVANYVRAPRQLAVLLGSMCVMLLYQWGIVMKMKFIDGFYQVRGLFEHQNPLAMFTYMAALPILSVALSPEVKGRRSLFYLITFAASGLIVLATLSRAAMAIFALGVVAVVAWGFVDRFTLRRIGVVFLMSLGGAVVLGATLDTIVARFNDEGNEASGETREVMNLASKAMVLDKPLGVGWNNFGKAINHPYPYGDVIDDWNRDRGQKVDFDYAKGVVESHYWLLLGETGYLGFGSYMLFIGVTQARLGWLMLRRRGTVVGALAAGLFIAFVLTYLHSDLERVLTQTKNLALWMTWLGVVAALPDLEAETPQPTQA